METYMKLLIMSLLIFAGCGSDKKNERSNEPTPTVEVKLTDGDNCAENQNAEFCESFAPVKEITCKTYNLDLFKASCNNDNPECDGQCTGYTPHGSWFPVPKLGSASDGSQDIKLRCQC
jgi:hypothetical protein